MKSLVKTNHAYQGGCKRGNSSGSKLVGPKANQQNNFFMNLMVPMGVYLSFLKLLGLIVPFLNKCTQGANPKQPFFHSTKFCKKKRN